MARHANAHGLGPRALLGLTVALAVSSLACAPELPNEGRGPTQLDLRFTQTLGNVVHQEGYSQAGEPLEAVHSALGRDSRLGVRLGAGDVALFRSSTGQVTHGDDAPGEFRFSIRSLATQPEEEVRVIHGAEECEHLFTPKRPWEEHVLEVEPNESQVRVETEGPVFVGEMRFVRAVVADQLPPNNYLVWLIDTLRADALRDSDSEGSATPFLFQLSSRATTAINSYSTAAWTRPSTASVLTGLFPSHHRANAQRSLPESVVTIAELFREAGFATAAFVENANIAAEGLGFTQGFDRFAAYRPRGLDGAEDAQRDAVEWIRQHEGERVFVYVHSIIPHAPYDSPSDLQARFLTDSYVGPIGIWNANKKDLAKAKLTEEDRRHVQNLYRAAVATQDRYLEDFFSELQQIGALKDLFTVITSDHGEEFYEHEGWEHGKRLWQEQVRVPLILLPPLHEPPQRTTINLPVQGVDVFPTLLAHVGIDYSGTIHGFDLLNPTLDSSIVDRLVLFEEIRHDSKIALYGLIKGDRKLIIRRNAQGNDRRILFDLVADPGEFQNLWKNQPEDLELLELFNTFREQLAGVPHQPVIEPKFSGEVNDTLKALGYL